MRLQSIALMLFLSAVALTFSPAWAQGPGTEGSDAGRLEPFVAVPAPPFYPPLDLPPSPEASSVAAANLSADAPPHEPAQEQYFTIDELRGEMKKLAWTKGDFTITPYGILWGNMAWESSRSYTGDYVFYVLRPKDDANQAFHADGRSTRLGIDVLGPRVECLGDVQTGGKAEVDFQGAAALENKGTLLLRHAYVEVKNDDYRLLIGQTWDVISPLNPGVLFYNVGWEGGNIGYRRAQFRGERYFAVSDDVLITAQGSLNVDLLSDTSTAYGADHAGWPVLEGRLGATLGQRGAGCHPIEMGVSSHVGEMELFLASDPMHGSPRRTWSFNTDIKVPITSHFGVQGELWMGDNLATFYGGIGQGLDTLGYNGVAPTLDPIFSRGGWVDVWYDWSDRWHSHVGYSIDDPIDSDVTSGRVYNAFIFGNVTCDLTAKFLVGLEFTSWRTIWKGPTTDVTDQHLEFVAKYNF